MNGYATVKEIADKWGISVRRVQILCAEGKIKGVSRFGKVWAIPIDAKRPYDGRITTGEYRDWRKARVENTENQLG